jgi:hypothetical protein
LARRSSRKYIELPDVPENSAILLSGGQKVPVTRAFAELNQANGDAIRIGNARFRTQHGDQELPLYRCREERTGSRSSSRMSPPIPMHTESLKTANCRYKIRAYRKTSGSSYMRLLGSNLNCPHTHGPEDDQCIACVMEAWGRQRYSNA